MIQRNISIPNLVAHDIVAVQPIDNSVGVINYIRYIYGNSKGVAVAGTDFASGILYTGSDPYYSSSEVVGEGVQVTAGAGGTIAANLAWKPIVKGSIKVQATVKQGGATKVVFISDKKKDGTLVAVDVEGHDLTGILDGSGNSINYDSGAVAVKFAIAIDLQNDGAHVDYRYDNMSIAGGAIGENALKVPEVNIKIDTMPIVCQSRKLKALYAFDAAYKLSREYGTDINALLNSQIASEIAHEIDGEIMDDLLHGAGLINDAFDMTRPNEISLKDHYDAFHSVMISGSNKIFGATKRAQATFIIAGLDVATIIESMTAFQASGARNVVGPHIAGTIGNLIVIKNPFYPSNKYVLGYKGVSLLDAGYFYCPYMPITTTQLVMLDDFVGRRGWATTYGKKLVQPLLYCAGEVTKS